MKWNKCNLHEKSHFVFRPHVFHFHPNGERRWNIFIASCGFSCWYRMHDRCCSTPTTPHGPHCFRWSYKMFRYNRRFLLMCVTMQVVWKRSASRSDVAQMRMNNEHDERVNWKTKLFSALEIEIRALDTLWKIHPFWCGSPHHFMV